jgi:hypothetical protein
MQVSLVAMDCGAAKEALTTFLMGKTLSTNKSTSSI